MTLKRIRKIEADIGEHIEHFIQRLLVQKKHLTNHPVIKGEFNEIVVEVFDYSTKEDLLNDYYAKCKQRRNEK